MLASIPSYGGLKPFSELHKLSKRHDFLAEMHRTRQVRHPAFTSLQARYESFSSFPLSESSRGFSIIHLALQGFFYNREPPKGQLITCFLCGYEAHILTCNLHDAHLSSDTSCTARVLGRHMATNLRCQLSSERPKQTAVKLSIRPKETESKESKESKDSNAKEQKDSSQAAEKQNDLSVTAEPKTLSESEVAQQIHNAPSLFQAVRQAHLKRRAEHLEQIEKSLQNPLPKKIKIKPSMTTNTSSSLSPPSRQSTSPSYSPSSNTSSVHDPLIPGINRESTGLGFELPVPYVWSFMNHVPQEDPEATQSTSSSSSSSTSTSSSSASLTSSSTSSSSRHASTSSQVPKGKISPLGQAMYIQDVILSMFHAPPPEDLSPDN